MDIEWDQAIKRQREALTRIVAMLFAMLGLDDGAELKRIGLPLYHAVLRVLVPAESAVRRLIVVMARGLVLKPIVRRPLPASLKSLKRKGSGRVSFQLCDPRKTFADTPRSAGPKSGPRIHAFHDGQLVTVFGRSPVQPAPQPETSIDASRLCCRLSAIKSALENLPREAGRLVRLQARRAKLPPEKYRKPLRPGRPPGHRKQGLLEVDEVLKDCHWLAWEAAKLNTS